MKTNAEKYLTARLKKGNRLKNNDSGTLTKSRQLQPSKELSSSFLVGEGPEKADRTSIRQ